MQDLVAVLRAAPLGSDESWQHLRAMRAQPPGRATSGERRRVFGSALEQAEQLFLAAAAVGYAARPSVGYGHPRGIST